jgi:lipopolysaccharide export LptBFGC system permease protein LptF
MWDVILGAILLAFGFLVIYFSSDQSKSDNAYLIALLVGIACVVAGGWIILTKVTLALLLKRIGGIILAAIGLFLIIGFPDVINTYQPEGYSKAGVFIGLVLLIIGLYMMFS